ncbi:tripartite tricarboxylate transporter TctB family protein [Xinfangfangia pollutisoli]|uniref:tripartite tricarboxylate transporter TctB family protein n=1 Tax=Xinfangfangia pollutisoli TaxID=2865960 RepID=UPI001CD43516|nr:tripartite tricarboxylate transporter TctB family protein [Xinfangfangia pollutisoli]
MDAKLNPRRADVESGLFFAGFGALTAALSLKYDLGSFAMMGPGMFPLLLGLCLSALGLAILTRGLLRAGDAARAVPLVPALGLTLSLIVFAVLVRCAGLAIAVPALVVTVLIPSPDFALRRAALLAVLLVVFCYLVFVLGLGVSLPMLSPPLSRWIGW